VARVVDFVSNQMEADYDDKYVNAKEASNGSSGSESGDDLDEEYEECRAFVIQMQKASTSLLQRKFRIGYNKAARIIDELEANGVIGPQMGSKPREVYIKSYSEEDEN
jgi:S-DNA-T family DNA segregation ATPase FtsK/SpoIIIE